MNKVTSSILICASVLSCALPVAFAGSTQAAARFAVSSGAIQAVQKPASLKVTGSSVHAVSLKEAIAGAFAWAKAGRKYLFQGNFLDAAGTQEADWLAIALGRYGAADKYAAYLNALSQNVTERYAKAEKLDRYKATEWHRISLAMLAVGGDPTRAGNDTGGQPVNLIADGTYNCIVSAIDRQGINGAIWGLIALDSKAYAVPDGAKYTRAAIIRRLLSRQNADGGFSLTGDASDPDITAMALEALAPYIRQGASYTYTLRGNKVTRAVRDVADECIAYLSSAQADNGDFGSMNTANAESCAEVVAALCTLGIDPAADARFIKNGVSALEALMRYRNAADGGFFHTPDGGKSNVIATEKSLCALVAYDRYAKNQRNLYDFMSETDQAKFVLNCGGKSFMLDFSAGKKAYTIELPLDTAQVLFASIPMGPYDTSDIAPGEMLPASDGADLTIRFTRRNGRKDAYTIHIATAAYAWAHEVNRQIARLPANVSLKDADTVAALAQSYEALSPAEQAEVANAARLIAAQNRIAELKKAADDKRLAQEKELREAIAALPSPISIDDKQTVEKLITKLSGMADFEGKDALMQTLSGYMQDITALETAAAALGQDVWDEIPPKNVTLKLKEAVAALMARYLKFSEKDRPHVPNADDLTEAQEIILSLEKGIIPAAVFERILGENTEYAYEGETNAGMPYAITFNGKDVKKAVDFNARITPQAENHTAVRRIAAGATDFRLMQEGAFPGPATVRLSISKKDGAWLLYYYNAKTKEGEFVKRVTLLGGAFSFTVGKGGDYFLTKTAVKAGIRSLISSDIRKGKVMASVFKEFSGQDVNIRIACKTDGGEAYTLTFNGRDITKPMVFDTRLSFSSANADFIRRLAENPQIVSFAQRGAWPCPMLVEFKTALPDGDYLLFEYDEAKMRAVYVRRVTVADGTARIIAGHGADYFIAARAKAASLKDTAAGAITPSPAASGVPSPAVSASPEISPPPVPTPAANPSYKENGFFLTACAAAGFVLLAALAVLAVLLRRRLIARKRG